MLELLVLMSSDEVYSGAVLAEGEWQLLCINRIPCSLGQMHGAVTAAFESAVWKCYQLDRVSEQKEWGISAWLSRLDQKRASWAALCTDQREMGLDIQMEVVIFLN